MQKTTTAELAPRWMERWPPQRRNLAAACLAHFLHDGYTDQFYALLPVWQPEFGLSYAGLALVRALYSGTMGILQVPADRFMVKLGARAALAIATFVAAAGYLVVALPLGLPGLCAGLVLAGIGSSLQHPRASLMVTNSYGTASRGPLGIYNFAGDLGKATFPALVALALPFMAWRPVVGLTAIAGLLTGFALLALAPRRPFVAPAEMQAETGGRRVAISSFSFQSARSIRRRGWGICSSCRFCSTKGVVMKRPWASVSPFCSREGLSAKRPAGGSASGSASFGASLSRKPPRRCLWRRR
jgi:hypothetical protein